MKNMKRSIALVVAIALLIGCAAGGTMAWLMDKSNTITNTFTTADVDIELTETKGNSFKMVPGAVIEKDPTVTVKKGSEACWLFVKVEKTTNFDEYMDCGVNKDWKLVDGEDDVYYRQVADTDADQAFDIIGYNKDSVWQKDKVLIKSDVDKEDMTAAKANAPTLTFTAYAIQQEGFATAKDAWTEAKNATTP